MAELLLFLKETMLGQMPVDKGIITIGRGTGNDIVLDNLAVSGIHARIVREKGVYLVEDLGSTNGTFVGGKRITKHRLRHDDRITVGKHALVFQDPVQTVADDDATVVIRRGPSVQDRTVVLDIKGRGLSSESAGKRVKRGGLKVIKGAACGAEHDLTDKLTTIGKTNGAKIALSGFFAPKVGAVISRVNDSYFLTPPGSWRKPKLNGNRLNKRCELKDGDVVEISGVILQFYLK